MYYNIEFFKLVMKIIMKQLINIIYGNICIYSFYIVIYIYTNFSCLNKKIINFLFAFHI